MHKKIHSHIRFLFLKTELKYVYILYLYSKNVIGTMEE